MSNKFDPTTTITELENFNSRIEGLSNKLAVLRGEQLDIEKDREQIVLDFHLENFEKIGKGEMTMGAYDKMLKHKTAVKDILMKQKKISIAGTKEQLEAAYNANHNYRLALKIEGMSNS